MTLKQKSEYNIGEKVVIFCNNVETDGIVADVKYDLGSEVQYIIHIAIDCYECRPGEYVWMDEEKETNDKDAKIEALLADLDDIFDELTDLSTPGHPVIPFMFLGIINGDRLDFHTLTPDEGESFEIGDENEVDFSAAKGLPVLSDIGLYHPDDQPVTDEDDLPPTCADYPDCVCGQMDIALYGAPLEVKSTERADDKPEAESSTLGDILDAVLKNKK